MDSCVCVFVDCIYVQHRCPLLFRIKECSNWEDENKFASVAHIKLVVERNNHLFPALVLLGKKRCSHTRHLQSTHPRSYWLCLFSNFLSSDADSLLKCPACQVIRNICHIIKCQQGLSTFMLPGSEQHIPALLKYLSSLRALKENSKCGELKMKSRTLFLWENVINDVCKSTKGFGIFLQRVLLCWLCRPQ